MSGSSSRERRSEQISIPSPHRQFIGGVAKYVFNSRAKHATSRKPSYMTASLGNWWFATGEKLSPRRGRICSVKRRGAKRAGTDRQSEEFMRKETVHMMSTAGARQDWYPARILLKQTGRRAKGKSRSTCAVIVDGESTITSITILEEGSELHNGFPVLLQGVEAIMLRWTFIQTFMLGRRRHRGSSPTNLRS